MGVPFAHGPHQYRHLDRFYKYRRGLFMGELGEEGVVGVMAPCRSSVFIALCCLYYR